MVNIDDLLDDLLSRPFSDEKAAQISDSLDWYLNQNDCDDTFRVTRDVSQQIFLNADAVVAWLKTHGATCDCQAASLLAELITPDR